jgi:hypothetical protein
MSCSCQKEYCNCFKIAEVMWWDTNESSDSGWMSEHEAKSTVPCKVKSLGYIINETQNFITIAADMDGNVKDKDDLLGRVQCFPRGCIIDIKYLS